MKNTWLKFLVAISAIMIAGSAAYFSVTGLGVLFSGAAVAVMVMAGSLEFAKLVSATYLKQEWDNITGVNKWYLTSAVVILMAITSAGIFGYLSNAFQQQNLKLEQVQREIDVWNNKIKLTNDQIVTLQGQQKDLSTTQNTLISKGNVNNRLIRSADNRDKQSNKISAKINSLQDSIVAYNGQINNIKNANINIEREVGGFRFVAEAFNVELKSVVKFFIILIVVVFDPLAVALIIAFNGLILSNKKDDEEEVKPTTNPEDLKNFVDETVRLRLSEEDLKRLEEVLLNPPPPNDALKEGVQKYDSAFIKKQHELLTQMMKDDQELGLYDEPYDNPLVKENTEEKWDGVSQEVWDRMKKIEEHRESIHGPILPEDEPVGALANSGIREKLDAVLDEANDDIDEFEKAIKEELNSPAPFGERFDIELVETPNDEIVPALSDEEVREMVMNEWEGNFDFTEDEVFENEMPPAQTEEEMVELDKEIIEDETVSFVDDTYMQHEIVEEFDGVVPEPFATPEEVERFNIDIKIIDNSPEFDFNIQQVTPTPEFDIEVKVVEPENEDDEKKNF